MTRTRSKHLRSGLAGAALALLLVVAAALPAAATYVPKIVHDGRHAFAGHSRRERRVLREVHEQVEHHPGRHQPERPAAPHDHGRQYAQGDLDRGWEQRAAQEPGTRRREILHRRREHDRTVRAGQPNLVRDGDLRSRLLRHDVRTGHRQQQTHHQGERHVPSGVRRGEPTDRSQPRGGDHGHPVRDERRPGRGEGPGWGEQPLPVRGHDRDGDRGEPRWGSLGGTTSQATSAGVASFAGLTIDEPGLGYRLVASSTGLGIATSDPFNIAGLEVSCADPEADCVGTLSNDTTTATVNAKADNESVTDLIMTLLDDDLDCDGYDETSSTVDFNVTSSTRYKEVTIRIDSGMISIEGSDPAAG